MCHFGIWITLNWRQLGSCGLLRNFYVSLTEFKLGALTIIRVITRDNFLWPSYMAGQTYNYWTTAPLIILQWPSTPLKPQGSYPILRSECHIYLVFSLCPLNLLCMWGLLLSHVHRILIHTYVIKFGHFSLVNMSHFYLIIRPAEITLRAEGSFFLPRTGKRFPVNSSAALCYNFSSDPTCLFSWKPKANSNMSFYLPGVPSWLPGSPQTRREQPRYANLGPSSRVQIRGLHHSY